MRLFLFSFVILSSLSASAFSIHQCKNADFSTQIEDAGIVMGKLKSVVGIQKNECDIVISLKKFEYLETIWKIDICREPVHVKYEKWKKQDVFKRKNSCSSGNQSNYCKSFFELKNLIEDKGLIYAEGRKEDLSSAHGQISCLYNLIKSYLNQGQVFAVGEVEDNTHTQVNQAPGQQIKLEEVQQTIIKSVEQEVLDTPDVKQVNEETETSF